MRLPETRVLRLEPGIWLTATIDDPATRNAMSDALLDDLLALLDAIEGGDAPHAIVLRGSEGLFCAGADLKGSAVARAPGATDDPAIALSRRGGELYRRFNACSIPTIAVIDGPAFGGGFGLACCADFVLCGPRARFALSETRLGLLPAQIGPFVLARIGLPAARRLALSGRRLEPKEALEIGLADAVYSDCAALDAGVRKVLDDIVQCAPSANCETKAMLLSLAGAADPDFIDRAATLFVTALRGPEAQEGIAAFAAKRKPNWIP